MNLICVSIGKVNFCEPSWRQRQFCVFCCIILPPNCLTLPGEVQYNIFHCRTHLLVFIFWYCVFPYYFINFILSRTSLATRRAGKWPTLGNFSGVEMLPTQYLSVATLPTTISWWLESCKQKFKCNFRNVYCSYRTLCAIPTDKEYKLYEDIYFWRYLTSIKNSIRNLIRMQNSSVLYLLL